MTESYVYDKLGRVKETKLANLYTKLFNYKQVGSQTSNLIASEWFGINGVIKDNLKYSYDAKGNITKVFENGELVQSFEYDSISRLVRLWVRLDLKKLFLYKFFAPTKLLRNKF